MEVLAWGTGLARREFLYVDDMANASIFVMNLGYKKYIQKTSVMSSHLNVGSGSDCSIKQLTQEIAKVVGYSGQISWDDSKPDGAPRKLLDVSRLTDLGWSANFGLHDGLVKAYDWYLRNK